MNNRFFTKAAAAAMSLVMSTLSMPFSVYASDQQIMNQTSDGYDYEFWNMNSAGDTKIVTGEDGAFSCAWDDIENVLFRTGRKLGSVQSWQDYDDIKYEYDVDYAPNGNSYMCVYGWSQNPLVEYYIVDAWGDWRPPGAEKPKAEINVDGKIYDVYSLQRPNQPSIAGPATFHQYWSVRKDNPASKDEEKNLKGTISVSDHFAAWDKAGMKLGDLYEVSFNIEGYKSSGEAVVNKAKLTFGGSDAWKYKNVKTTVTETGTTTTADTETAATTTVTVPKVTTPAVEPDSEGYYFKESFEDGIGKCVPRGEAALILDSENYVDGEKSLFVTHRDDVWQGPAIELDPSAFVPGKTYSFGAAVLQHSDTTAEVNMVLQYTDAAGYCQYSVVSSVDAEKSEWTELGNPSFTIPDDAKEMMLFIDTPDGIADFYFDSFFGGVEGKTLDVSGGTSNDPDKVELPVTSKGNGFKDKFSRWFKIGTSASVMDIKNGGSFIKENFNSITPENELKPDAILDQEASQKLGKNVNPQVDLHFADPILKFCEENGISLRGHTFVWHSQTPDWFFRENFSSNGALVSKEVMDQRLENFIKNTFKALKDQYPDLEIAAYDVCNEIFVNDGGALREGKESKWAQIYGDSDYITNAFKYARKYAPTRCRLFLNDYNEYLPAKTKDICQMAMALKEDGLIDGIGMQSHLDTRYPDMKTYKNALEAFISTGLEVQITELDVTCINLAEQADIYYEVFKQAMNNSESITTVTVWGLDDSRSWRFAESPCLFWAGFRPKPAYTKVISLADPFYTRENGLNPWGDANEDKKVDISDSVMIMQSLANPSKYSMDKIGNSFADVNLTGNGITNADALAVQKYLVGLVEDLPESYEPKEEAVTTTAAETTTAKKTTATAALTTTAKPTTAKESTVKTTTEETTTAPDTTTEIAVTETGKTFVVGNGSSQYKGVDEDNYDYEVWLDQSTGGVGSLTLGKGGAFTAEWDVRNPQGLFLAQSGKIFNSNRKASDYKGLCFDYEVDFESGDAGNAQVGVYGWMKDPLVEYYIIEDWKNWRPTSTNKPKTVVIDGGEYEIFTQYMTGPCILGSSETFKRYYSVRKEPRKRGTINISKHFEAWEKAGFEMGTLYQASFDVEAWQSAGKLDVKKLSLYGMFGGVNNETLWVPISNEE